MGYSEEKARRRSQMTKAMRRTGRPNLWLISNGGDGRDDVLNVDHDGERSLAVFGFREEAELYLRSAGLGDGWRAVDTKDADVLSLLRGPFAHLGGVVFDPLPNGFSAGLDGSARFERGRFVDWLSRRRGHVGRGGAR